MTAAAPEPAIRAVREVNFAPLQDSETERAGRALMAGFGEARRSLRVRTIEESLGEGDREAIVGPVETAILGVAVVAAGTFRAAALEANLLSPSHVFDEGAPGVAFSNRVSRQRISGELVAGLDSFIGEVQLIGNARNWTARQIARELRADIGLNAFGARAVDNFRRLLEQGDAAALRRALRDRRFDPTILRGIAGEALTRAQIERMVDRYRARTIAQRAELIARLEVQRQIGQGLNEYFEQAFEVGALDRDEVEQIWRIRPPNVRASHSFMASQRRPVGTPFQSGDGNNLRFPGDPFAPISDTARCKCGIRVLRRST